MTLITPSRVAEKLNISRTTLWRIYNDPELKFPRKIHTTNHQVRYVDEEINDWIRSRRDDAKLS